MAIDFEADLTGPTDTELKDIVKLVNDQLNLEAEVATLEAQLKVKSAELRKVSEKDLPDAMKAAGIEETKLANGVKISIKDEMSIHVSKERLPSVLQWLRDNNHDDIVKTELAVPLGKGFDPKALAKIKAGLDKMELAYTVDDNVNSSTLKALLREQLEKGAAINLEDFGAYKVKKSVIKMPKA